MLFVVALSLAGCGGQSAAPADASTGTVIPAGAAADGLVVTFGTEPSPPEKGENRIQVTVRRSDGSPVTAGTVTAMFSMPAMPSMNMPEMHSSATLEHQGAGRYVGTGALVMNGTWNVTVTVSRGDAELGSSRFTLLAK